MIAEKYVDGAKVISDWLGAGAHPVTKEEAQARANACLDCVNNTKKLSLAMFAPVLKRIVEIKNTERLRVSGEKSLGVCSVCECHLATKIWTPIEHIAGHTDKDEFPAWCWIRREMENL